MITSDTNKAPFAWGFTGFDSLISASYKVWDKRQQPRAASVVDATEFHISSS